MLPAALVLSFIAGISRSQIADFVWIEELERNVLSNYSYNVSPVMQKDEQALEHSNILGLQVSWTDPRLTWNVSNYGGIDHLYIKLSKVWAPEAQFCESTSVTYLAPRYAQFVKVSSNGVVEMQKYIDVTFACNFDTFRFPFDVQHCMYCLTLPFYTSDEFVLQTSIDGRVFVQACHSLLPISDTSEWALELTGLSYNSFHEQADFFYFNITMTRRPAFWVSLIILPTFLLVTVVLLGLFFGSAHEPIEKVSLGLATMMSMTVNVGILNESLAKSETLPIIGWFVLWEIVLITLAVMCVLLLDQTRRRLLQTANRPPSPRDGLIENRKNPSAKSINRTCSAAHHLLFIILLILHATSLTVLLCLA